jgi:hypothetical protein
MELLLKMKIENIFKAKDFEDKKSGEIKVSKWKLQGFEHVETAEGSQMKLIDVSIPDNQYTVLKDKVGQTVSIPVKTFINNNRVGFYGV